MTSLAQQDSTVLSDSVAHYRIDTCFDFSKRISLNVARGIQIDQQQKELIQSKDSIQLSLRRKHYSRCDILYPYAPPEAQVDDITIQFSCNDQQIKGIKSNGKVKWAVNTQPLTREMVAIIREWKFGKYWEKGRWDTLIYFYDDILYVLKSRNGKIKRVKWSDIFKREQP